MTRLILMPVLILLLLQACSAMPQQRAHECATRAASRTTMFVARRGWHIDIGFSTLDLEAPLASLRADFPGSRYVFFGFGDRHYLIAKHKNFPGMLAALWPGAGMVLATRLAAAPEEAFGAEHVIRLQISAADALAAQRFVWNSLLKENGAPTFYAKGPYEGSLFLGAVPKYSAVHTCNTWAAEVLRAAGLPVHSGGVLFAAQLWSQTRRIDAGASARISDGVAPVAD
jgi:hypothetical protein